LDRRGWSILFTGSAWGRKWDPGLLKIGFNRLFNKFRIGAALIDGKMTDHLDQLRPEPKAGLHSLNSSFRARHAGKASRLFGICQPNHIDNKKSQQ